MTAIPREQMVKVLSDMQDKLRAEGVLHLSLVGSRARRDERPDSDIDVLIDVEPGRSFSLLDLVGVAHVIEDATGLPAHVLMRRSLTGEWQRMIARDAIDVF